MLTIASFFNKTEGKKYFPYFFLCNYYITHNKYSYYVIDTDRILHLLNKIKKYLH